MLLELWEWLLTNVKDNETKGHIIEAILDAALEKLY